MKACGVRYLPALSRALMFCFGVAVVGCDDPAGSTAGQAPPASDGPNVVLFLVDDLRWDALGVAGEEYAATPHIDRLAWGGAYFTQSFVVQSVCAPSRATLLTGLYAHDHGVTYNEGPSLDRSLPSLPIILRERGYETAFVGKWHLGGDGSLEGWFDHWLSFRNQGEYLDAALNVDGRFARTSGHITDAITDYAVDYLRRSHQAPFFLIVSHKAVHAPLVPQARFEGLHAGDPIQPPATFNIEETGKPGFLKLRSISRDTVALIDQIRRYRETLAGVDESLGKVIGALDESGSLDGTLVIFTSDNGYLLGEHNLSDKRVAYEASIRVPLIVSYPAWFPNPITSDAIVLNIDIAPTVLDAVGVAGDFAMTGYSLRALVGGDKRRRAFFYEYSRDPRYPLTPPINAIRTDRWKLIEYLEGGEPAELYDLQADPLEITNLIEDQAYASVLDSLQLLLLQMTWGVRTP